MNGDREAEQSDVESDDHSDEGIVVPKPRTVVPVPTPRRTWGLSVTPQVEESSLVQLNGSVDVVHLDNADLLSSGIGQLLSEELMAHGSRIEPGCDYSDVSVSDISSSSDFNTGSDIVSIASNTPVPGPPKFSKKIKSCWLKNLKTRSITPPHTNTLAPN